MGHFQMHLNIFLIELKKILSLIKLTLWTIIVVYFFFKVVAIFVKSKQYIDSMMPQD